MDSQELVGLLDCMEALQQGSSVVVARFCKEIGLPDVVDRLVDWTPGLSEISPGELIMGLVVNVLGDREALYRVKEFYKGKDLSLIFGRDIDPELLNNYALARALDKMHEAGCQRIFTEVILSALTVHEISVRTGHFDTTSKSVQGEYDDPDPDSIDIAYGYSRDKRPDLKQIVFGLGTNREGIPIYGEVLSGNQDDTTWNRSVIKKIGSLLPSDLMEEMIYVADSSMVTVETLHAAESRQIKFISRMPARFKLVSELVTAAWQDSQPWQDLGHFSSAKNAATYRGKTYFADVEEVPYRFLVVHSSSLDRRKLSSLERTIGSERTKIEKAARELARRDFVCIPDAEKAVEEFQRKWSSHFHELDGRVTTHVRQEKRKKPGRPRKDEPAPPSTTVYHAELAIIGVDQAQVEREQKLRSSFVLITNLKDETEYPDEFILREYKEQPTVESLFRFLKSPYTLGPVFVKKPSRVEAIGYVLLMAVLIAMLLQRRVRMNLAEEEEPLRIPGDVLTHALQHG